MLTLLPVLCGAPVAVSTWQQDRDADTWLPTVLERDAGWSALFDGCTSAGWRGYRNASFPEQGWQVEAGCLHRVPGPGGGDLVSERTFEDFELELEWRIAPNGNSGLKYRVVEREDRPSALGPEYQIADDSAPEIDRPEHSCGALYALWAPEAKPALAVESFHRTRIVVREGWIEHWLDGVRVVRARIGDEEWARRKAASKFKDVARFGEEEGHVLLQDHGSEVWFRRIRIRDLSNPVGEPVELHDGESLEGWRAYGDARWTPEPEGILGESGGGHHSFLATERELGDFVLEVDVKNEKPGNSGLQVRSHATADGRLMGYQIEIDPSPRAWSGGLYDEGRRGWLQDLEENAAARAAFRPGEWNRFRIECIGPSIKTWVNGVPAADYLDALDLSGVIGLQVHGGEDTRVRWRNFRVWSLGTRSWLPVFDGQLAESWEIVECSNTPVENSRMEVADGVIVATPNTTGEGHLLMSRERMRDFSLRIRCQDANGELRIDRHDRAPSGGSLYHSLGMEMPCQGTGLISEVSLQVHGQHFAVDCDGKRIFPDEEFDLLPAGPVSLHWRNLSRPARIVAIDVMGPLRDE